MGGAAWQASWGCCQAASQSPGSALTNRDMQQLLQKEMRRALEQTPRSSHGPLFIDATPLWGRSAIRALSRVYRAGFDLNSERKLRTVGESWERMAGRLPASQFLGLLPSEMGSGPRRLHDVWRPRPKVWQSGLSHQVSVTPQMPGATSWNLVADLSWKERGGSH